MVSLRLQHSCDKAFQIVAFELLTDEVANQIVGVFFKINRSNNLCFDLFLNVRLPRGIGSRVTVKDRLDTLFGVIALNPADRHKRAEGEEQVLGKG